MDALIDSPSYQEEDIDGSRHSENIIQDEEKEQGWIDFNKLQSEMTLQRGVSSRD